MLSIALILWRLGNGLRTLNTLSQLVGYPNFRVSIYIKTHLVWIGKVVYKKEIEYIKVCSVRLEMSIFWQLLAAFFSDAKFHLSFFLLLPKKQDRFTTLFKTCGTGSLFWGVGRVSKQTERRTDGGWVQSTFGAKAEQVKLARIWQKKLDVLEKNWMFSKKICAFWRKKFAF